MVYAVRGKTLIETINQLNYYCSKSNSFCSFFIGHTLPTVKNLKFIDYLCASWLDISDEFE